MPELPEVETIRQDLLNSVIGQKIVRVRIIDPKVVVNCSSPQFIKMVENRKIVDVLRRGKYLIFSLSAESGMDTYLKTLYLVIHLKLTGQLILGKELKNCRLMIYFDGNDKVLNFCDQRRFGEVRIVDDWQKIPTIQKMGPEPLEKQFTLQWFKENLVSRNKPIKVLLMEQDFIAGIGNIYAQEALFLAGILPTRKAASLNFTEIKKLYHYIKCVLQKAIKYRGSSPDTYVDVHGNKGQAQLYHYVYGRENGKCKKCDTILHNISLSGRGTVFCPKCQK